MSEGDLISRGAEIRSSERSGPTVWVIKAGEPLPIAGTERPLRAATVARTLAARGCDVTYWGSTFSHQLKRHHFTEQTEIALAPGLTLIALHGPAYRTNVSLARLRNHREEAARFLQEAERRPAPDVIVAAMPTLDLAEAAVTFGHRLGVPVVVDLRDMWPDALTFQFATPVRWALRWPLIPFHRQLRRVLHGADVVFAISDAMLSWGLRFAMREPTANDRVFRSGYVRNPLDGEGEAAARAFWQRHGVSGQEGQHLLLYVGTLTSRAGYRMLDVVRAFREQGADLGGWRLVFCGTGPLLDDLRVAAAGDERVILPGWVGQAELGVLLRQGSIGLLPYPETPDFLSACPNKFGEYLGQDLPVVSMLEGEVGSLVAAFDCGWVRKDGSAIVRLAREIQASPDILVAKRANARALYDQAFDGPTVYGAYAEAVEAIAARGVIRDSDRPRRPE